MSYDIPIPSINKDVVHEIGVSNYSNAWESISMTIYSRKNPPSGSYVYAYIRSTDSDIAKADTPYYIGQGTGPRAWKHGKKESVKTPKDHSKIIILEANMSNLGAQAIERRMIRWYGRVNKEEAGILRNKTDGGEGTTGIIRTAAHCAALSASLKGRTQTAERIAKQVIALTGIVQSEETKAKRSRSLTGSKRTPEQCANIKTGVNNPEAKLKKYIATIGKTRSDETKNNMRLAHRRPDVLLKNKRPKGPQKITECVYCSKIGGASLITRYHNNNCKFKDTK